MFTTRFKVAQTLSIIGTIYPPVLLHFRNVVRPFSQVVSWDILCLTQLEPRMYLYNNPKPEELEKAQACLRSISDQSASDWNHLRYYVTQGRLSLMKREYMSGLSSIDEALNLLESGDMQEDLNQNLISKEQVKVACLNIKAKLAAASGQKFLSENAYAQAISSAKSEDALITKENLGILVSSRAALLNDLGKHSEAKSYHEKAYHLDSKNAVILQSYARGLHQYYFAEARHLTQSQRLTPQTGKNVQSIFAQHFDCHFDFIQSLFSSSLNLHSDPTTLRYRANFYFDLKATDEALEDLNLAIKIDPDNAMSHFSRALIYWQEGKDKRMKLDLQRAIELFQYHTTPICRDWSQLLEQTLIPFMTENLFNEDYFAVNPYDDALTHARYNALIMNDLKAYQEQFGLPDDIPTPREKGIMTHQDYARLASDAYSKPGRYTSEDLGWKPYATVDDLLSETQKIKYYGVAFVNHDTKDVVISHQGTCKISDVVTDLKFLLDRMDMQFWAAYQFTQHIQKQMQLEYPEYRLSHTGHSLGALLAEVIAYHLHLEAVTFESPGSRDLLIESLRSHSNPDLMITEQEEKHHSCFVTYLADPNLVNTAKRHLRGQLRKIYPINQHSIPSQILSWFNRRGGQTLQSHGIVQLANVFDGLHRVMKINDWPCGIYTDYLQFGEYLEKVEKTHTKIDLMGIESEFFKSHICHYQLEQENLYCISISRLSENLLYRLSTNDKIPDSETYQLLKEKLNTIVQERLNQKGNWLNLCTEIKDNNVYLKGWTHDELLQYFVKNHHELSLSPLNQYLKTEYLDTPIRSADSALPLLNSRSSQTATEEESDPITSHSI